MTARLVDPNGWRYIDAPRVYGLGMGDRLAVESLVEAGLAGRRLHDAVTIVAQYDGLVKDGLAEKIGHLTYRATATATLACRPSVPDAGHLRPGDVIAGGDVVIQVWEYPTYFAIICRASNGVVLTRFGDVGYRYALWS